jgi:rhodanese-related sulfurtransferase
MRRIVALLALSLVWMGVAAAAAPQIAVDLQTYNYPDTIEGIAVVHVFVLSNVGDQDLVIESAKPGCICTTAELSTNRLLPGQSGELRAIVDTEGLSGRVVRTITITSNAPGPYNEYRMTVSFAGNVVDRQPYQTSVAYLFERAYLLVDVRDATAYAAGHLLGAMNVPASESASRAAGLPPSALIVIYDQNGSTSTLTAVSQALHGGGLASVYALRGGLDLWQKTYKASLVVAGGTGPWGSFVDVSGVRAYSTGTLQNFEISKLKSWYHVLIDLRSPSAYAAGHLAGAVNVDESGVAAFLGTLPSDIDVILYSDDGSDSDRVVYSLWMRGSRAQSLLGGLAEWQTQHGNFLVVSSSG